MKLVELDASFIRREVRQNEPKLVDDGQGGTKEVLGDDHFIVDTLAESDGILFLCPKCFVANGGKVGTHSVICWRPRIAPDVDPKPGRWEFEGTSLNDLTLRAGSSSILLTGQGCQAHFHITNGEIC
jgi:hypothetical protein